MGTPGGTRLCVISGAEKSPSLNAFDICCRWHPDLITALNVFGVVRLHLYEPAIRGQAKVVSRLHVAEAHRHVAVLVYFFIVLLVRL